MKKLLSLIICSIFIISITGCVKTVKLENGEEVIAELEGKQYTANDLYVKLKEAYGTSALIDLIDKYIISKELEDTSSEIAQAKSYIEQMKNYYESAGSNWEDILSSNGFTKDSIVEYYAMNYERETVAKNYYKSIIENKDIEKYYQDEIIGDISAKQILIVPEVSDSATDEEKEKAKTDAYNKALEVIKKLDEGNDFSTLAKEYSADEASSSVGGDIAPFNKQSNHETEFIEHAINLNVGSYSKTPVKTKYGYHILYVVSKDEKPTLDDVKSNIISTLANEKMEKETNYLNKALKAMREKYNLNIYDTVIKERYDQIMSQY